MMIPITVHRVALAAVDTTLLARVGARTHAQ